MAAGCYQSFTLGSYPYRAFMVLRESIRHTQFIRTVGSNVTLCRQVSYVLQVLVIYPYDFVLASHPYISVAVLVNGTDVIGGVLNIFGVGGKQVKTVGVEGHFFQSVGQ